MELFVKELILRCHLEMKKKGINRDKITKEDVLEVINNIEIYDFLRPIFEDNEETNRMEQQTDLNGEINNNIPINQIPTIIPNLQNLQPQPPNQYYYPFFPFYPSPNLYQQYHTFDENNEKK